jgi:hypothetical protein
MYPEGTNPFRNNPEGMYPLCGLIHVVDVSRRERSTLVFGKEKNDEIQFELKSE